MATANVNGIRLFYELSGTGDIPLVLVHGSWDSHQDWELVVPRLAESFRVLTYDRRGHSQSERPAGQGSVHEDVADLAALIEHLGLGPAWVVGNSFGASITLRLAVERPDLLRGIIVHEPPLFGLLADDPSLAPVLDEIRERVGAVVDRIVAGDHAGAAEQFVEKVALGPSAWAQLPPESQQTLIENAPTFLDEANDPEQLAFDREQIIPFSRPVLLTKGEQSPPIFAPVVAKIADVLPAGAIHTFPGAGHIPHVTHPDAYIEATMDFINDQTHFQNPFQSKIMKLPEPACTGSVTLEEAFRKRRTSRTYSGLSLRLSELSQLLWAAGGVTGESGQRATPSAGGQYPLHLYVVAGAVGRLPAGLYEYAVEEHSLVRLSDEDLRPALGNAAIGNQPWVREAAVIIVVAADFERIEAYFHAQPPRGERGVRYAYIETGALTENVHLQAVGLGLGAVLVGGFDDEQVQEAMPDHSFYPTALLCVGRKKNA